MVLVFGPALEKPLGGKNNTTTPEDVVAKNVIKMGVKTALFNFQHGIELSKGI